MVIERGAHVSAVETTVVPADATVGHYGATAYFAVLCFPGTDVRSHRRRNQFSVALLEYIRGIVKARAGFRRISRARAKTSMNSWLNTPPSMKNERVFVACNRAETILRNQRLPCAWIASQLGTIQMAEELRLQKSALQIQVGGPQRLTGLIETAAERLGLAEPRTMWRYWNETLPVLHLALAFYFLQPDQKPGDRPQIIVRCVRDHQMWLAKAIGDAENRALHYLPAYTSFNPAKRICLMAE